MARWSVEEARAVLSGVVAEELLEAYCALRESGTPLLGEAERALGPDVVKALRDRGMAHLRSHSERLVPTAPDLVLHTALIEIQRRLMDGHKRLATAQERMAEASRWVVVEDLVRVVVDREEITDLSISMINLAKSDWMTLENLLQETPMDDAAAIAPLPVFAGGVRCRSIYEEAFLDHPAGTRNIRAAVDAGEQARVIPHVGMKFKMADESTALLPLNPTGLGGALLVRCPAIVGALREYFEILWFSARPIGGDPELDESGLSKTQMKVLRLMNEGMQDQSIALRLGISAATVRRHVTKIREQLDVESRFGMGAAAVRRGWI